MTSLAGAAQYNVPKLALQRSPLLRAVFFVASRCGQPSLR